MPSYTIGSTNPSGASNGTNTGITASSLWLTKRTLSGAAAGATWVALRAWITGAPSGTETHLRLAIYDDLAGSPNNLIGGGEITVPVGAAAAEYTFTLPGTAPATNGDYWVGFHFATTSVGPAPWYATSGGQMAYGNPTYGLGLPSPYVEAGTNGVNDIRVAADASTPAAVTPVADFTGTPLTGVLPLSVALTDASTNTPTSWAWTFGDGGTSSSQNPTHSYATAGTYTVVLVATNAAGSNTKTRTGYVVVSYPSGAMNKIKWGTGLAVTDEGSNVIRVDTTGGAVVATDAIWDAAGDLAVGSGADTAARLALGSSGKVLRSNGSTAVWDYPPGYEFDYVERTTALTVTATSDATADTFITGTSVTYDGSTVVLIMVYVPFGSATVSVIVNLYDGSTDLGRMGQINAANVPFVVTRRLTPSAAAHTYSARAWKSSGTSSLNGGAGGAATNMPSFLKIVKA